METFHAPLGALPFPFNFTIPSNQIAAFASPANSITPWMDSRIWSRLPQRLIDRIIAFLPVPAFFRARAVCKRWYSLLFSSSFLQLYLQVSPRSHWFIFFKQKTLKNFVYRNNSNADSSGNSCNRIINEGYLFDPSEEKWYRIYFPSVPQGFSPAASSGGLICWVSEEAGSKNILLSNPVTGSLSALPATLRPRLFPSIGLTITNSSIDLAVAGDDLISPYAVKNLSTESFHVDAGGFYSIWGTTSALPRLCSLESGRMVSVAGRFYCMNYSPFSILSYDVGSNEWSKIQAPMRRFLRSPNLIRCKRKLVLVAAVEKSKLNVPKSLRLWALQECGNNWVEIERMPQQLYLQFSDMENGQGFNCVGYGDFVVIMIRGKADKAVMFDFCRKRWVWIPPCPYINGYAGAGAGVGGGYGGDHQAADELHGFGYEPRLATPVTALLDQLTLPFQSFNV
ncbi:OLC1v1025492C1 [Oldenlandia corymbosa var. corymbosa]|uniref:OLC1v1025492C1 n=1 Tax=Oldenlandia corymbosa var. corymbosa TaxID=529605 RepID=A0AAV1C725_OLDCO|nr:OLC1v1025492C1 [Oldenlandia corymbosa var. corymbosa]